MYFVADRRTQPYHGVRMRLCHALKEGARHQPGAMCVTPYEDRTQLFRSITVNRNLFSFVGARFFWGGLTLLALVTLGLALWLPGELARAQEGPIEYAENSTGDVATFTADDPDDDEVTWTKNGADQALFAISEDGVLTFVSPPDYEAPGDQGTNNIYEVTVTATDDDDSPLAGSHSVMIEVTNEEEAATVGVELSSLQPQVSTGITVNYVDSVGNPNVNADGAAHTGIVDDDRDKDAPTSSNIPSGDVTWQWSKSSSKGGTYTDIPGDEAKAVSYTPGSSDRGMYLRVTGTYEDGEGEGKTVQATSAYAVRAFPSGNSAPAFPEDFDPQTDDNQDPAAEIDDGATAGAAVGDPITASDANSDRLTYSLTADADVFQVDRETGQVTVGLGKTVHPTSDTGETASAAIVKGDSFTFTITATDPSGLTDTVDMTVTVAAADEAPVFADDVEADHTFAENTTDLDVGTFAATDVERDNVTYAMSGADMSKFTLGNNGDLSFQAAPNFEAPGSADGDNVYEVTITAASTGNADGATEKRTALDVTVTVTNEDDPGTISLSAAQPRVRTALTATAPSDPDGGVSGVTWKWESAATTADFDNDNDITEIEGATAASYTPVTGDATRFLRATASYTDAHGPNKSTSVVAGQAVETARNLAPVFTDEDDETDGVQLKLREVPENSVAGTGVGGPILATDTADDETDDNNDLAFTLSGADAGLFDIASPGGQITVAAGAQLELDHEIKDTYTVTVTVRDLEGLNSSIDLTIMVTNVNEAPEISGISSVEFLENSTGDVATFTADDPDDDEVTWTKNGADQALFAISEDGVLTFVSPPDYEAPGDQGTNNIYEVTVTATDDDDSPLAGSHSVMIEVTNEEEAATVGVELSSLQPQVSTGITVNYVDSVGNPNVNADGAAHTGIVDDDRDKDAPTSSNIPSGDVTWQWSKSSSKGGTYTDIPGDEAKAVSYTPGSSDRGMYLRVTGTYEDGEGEGKTVQATSAYAVRAFPSGNSAPAFPEDFDPQTDDNQDPAAEIDDGATAGAAVGDPITASDANSDRLTYSLTADADVFQVDRETGQVTVGLGKTVHPTSDTGETASAAIVKGDSFTFTITATDPSGLTDTVDMTVTVAAADEAPVFADDVEADHTFAENTTDLDVGTFAATDVERDNVTYAMSGADMSKFTLGNNGDLSFQAAPNFEAPGSADGDNVYEVTITAASTGNADGATEKRTALDVTVTVTNEDDPGTISLSAAQPRVRTALTATAPSDPDGGVSGVTWKWESAATTADFDNDNDITEIEGATAASYTPVTGDATRFLRATASYTDAHGPNKSTSVVAGQAVETARNLAPVFTDEDDETDGVQLKLREVPENSVAGTGVGGPILATDTADDETDDNNDLAFTLSGADAGLFDIASPGGQITVAAGAQLELDHEIKDTYTVTVTVRDLEGLNSSIDLTIMVTNVNEAPTVTLGGLAISGNRNPEVEEGTTAVATYMAAGPNADMATWDLSGADALEFVISSEDGVLTFVSPPDYEAPRDQGTNNIYEVTVTAGDGTYMDTHEVTVTVTNAEETGTATLSSDMLIVGEAVTATVTDPDVVATSTEMWQWATADDAGFTMNVKDITGATMASYTPVEADGGKYLRASVTYDDGYGADKAEATGADVVMVTSNGPPAFAMATTSRDVAENSEADAVVGDPVVATDPDNDDVTYGLSGADATDFSIHDTGQITVGQGTMLDYETRTTYTVTVTATDPSGETAIIEVTINVTNVGLDTPYDADDGGAIDKPEMIEAINDYLFGSGDSAISKEDLIGVINLYLFG